MSSARITYDTTPIIIDAKDASEGQYLRISDGPLKGTTVIKISEAKLLCLNDPRTKLNLNNGEVYRVEVLRTGTRFTVEVR